MAGSHQKLIVSSGSYIIGAREPRVLEAVLGSCVGVTLVDEKNGVGGMIHILLPEPTGSSAGLGPEMYAISGLPLFIREMIGKGAAKENLRAAVAGGALVGRVSELDVNLDVGGRTADMVGKILAGEGVPIRLSDTGGYLGCVMELDLATMKTAVKPISPMLADDDEKPAKPTDEELKKAVANIRPIPQIALKIIRIINEGDYNVSEVAEEVRRDQVIGARVLQLCNSSALGLRAKVDSIDRALLMLGESTLLQLVVCAACQDYFVQSDSGYSLRKGGMYQHAVGAAMIAARLAKYTETASPDLAYTAGLLHDIGKIALDRFVSRSIPTFYRMADNGAKDLVAMEDEILGRNHTEIGKLLARAWSFPGSLQEAISYHHHPESAVLFPELTSIVYISDLLMTRFQAGVEMDFITTDDLHRALSRLGIKDAGLPELVEMIPQNPL